MRVLDTVGETNDVQSPIQEVLDETNELVRTVQNGQLPNPVKVSELLQKVQDGEAELSQELADLQNSARHHVPGELEAYLELKHSLTETLPKLRQLENHLAHVLHIMTRRRPHGPFDLPSARQSRWQGFEF